MKSLSSRLMDTRLLGAPWRELSILSATNDISHPYLSDPQGKDPLSHDRHKTDRVQGYPVAATALIHSLLARWRWTAPKPGRPAARDCARERCAFPAKSLMEKR